MLAEKKKEASKRRELEQRLAEIKAEQEAQKDAELAEQGKFKELLEFHVENGTDGIVPCGCTGEAATLSHDEQKRLMDITMETVGGRVPVIAGAGSNYTKEALDLTRHAKKAGRRRHPNA